MSTLRKPPSPSRSRSRCSPEPQRPHVQRLAVRCSQVHTIEALNGLKSRRPITVVCVAALELLASIEFASETARGCVRLHGRENFCSGKQLRTAGNAVHAAVCRGWSFARSPCAGSPHHSTTQSCGQSVKSAEVTLRPDLLCMWPLVRVNNSN